MATDAQALLQKTLAGKKQTNTTAPINVSGGAGPLPVEPLKKPKRRADEVNAEKNLQAILNNNNLESNFNINNSSDRALLNSNLNTAMAAPPELVSPTLSTASSAAYYTPPVPISGASPATEYMLQNMQNTIAEGGQGGGATSTGAGEDQAGDQDGNQTQAADRSDVSQAASNLMGQTLTTATMGSVYGATPKEIGTNVATNLASSALGPAGGAYSSAVQGYNTYNMASGLIDAGAYKDGILGAAATVNTGLMALNAVENILNSAQYVTSRGLGGVLEDTVESFANTVSTVAHMVTNPVETFHNMVTDMGNMLEFGTTNPEVYAVPVGYGNSINYVTDAVMGDLRTPGLTDLMLAGSSGPAALKNLVDRFGRDKAQELQDVQFQSEAAFSGQVDLGVSADNLSGNSYNMTTFSNPLSGNDYVSVGVGFAGSGTDVHGVVDLTGDVAAQLGNLYDNEWFDPNDVVTPDRQEFIDEQTKAINDSIAAQGGMESINERQAEQRQNMVNAFGPELQSFMEAHELLDPDEPGVKVTADNIGINLNFAAAAGFDKSRALSSLTNIAEEQTAVSMQGNVDTAGNFDPFATGSGYFDSSFEVDEPTGPAEAYDPNLTGPGYTTGFDPDTGEGDTVGGPDGPGGPGGSGDTSAETGVEGTDMSSGETSMDTDTDTSASTSTPDEDDYDEDDDDN